MLVVEERSAWVVAHHLAVGRGWPLHSPVTATGSCTNARMAAWWAWSPVVHRNVYQVTVKNGSVGWGPHRLSVEFHLLLWVPELQGARSLVRRRLFPVGQGNGGRQVNLVLHVGVGGLETTERIPLDEGRGGKPIPAPRGTHDLERKEKKPEDILSITMTNNGTGKLKLVLCSHQFSHPLEPMI